MEATLPSCVSTCIQREPVIANMILRGFGQIAFPVYEQMFVVNSTEMDK
jgi:hypothetical protein